MSTINLDDWIAAIATPAGSGGIGIVRVSGNGCIDQCDLIFRSKRERSFLNKKAIQLYMELSLIQRREKM